jgi:OOP family OmpA-OmpF porin
MQVMADKEYWVGRDGNYARDRNGHCVRTILWTPEAAIPGCEGGVDGSAKSEAAPVADKQMAEKPAKQASEAAVVAAPAYTELNLASGATFELGGSTLSAEGKAAVVELMNQFKGEDVKSVIIEGYTDDTGAASFNQQLSEKRAEAVKAELVANGANADKITTVGYGESNPIADNSTREGRAQNRRIEIKFDGRRRKI